MDLSTTYLGLTLPHPLMPGASPLADDLDEVRRLEDAGASAIVMRSLFEEQITQEAAGVVGRFFVQDPAAARALAYFPAAHEYAFAPDRYLEHLQRVRRAASIPVVASLNGTTSEGWLYYARLMQEAGAHAIELNFYHVAADSNEPADAIERRLVDIVTGVRHNVSIPVAVKLSPFFTSLPHVARALDEVGAAGLVLFNQFFQPVIDAEMEQAVPRLRWSSSDDLQLRVQWTAILSGQVEASLAVTGGIRTGRDAITAVLAGAHAVQLVSALMMNGPKHLVTVRREVARWLEERGFASLREAQGSLSLQRCPDAEAFERGSYLRALQSWRERGIGNK